MIASLRGLLVECEPGRATVDVGGVGYDVLIPLSTYYEIAEATDSTVRLLVHTHVREDALQLFGFCTEAEREAFRRFIGISGVGPKLALAVLSGMPVAELADAVESNDSKRIQRIPGVGRKTAERLIVELRDRLPGLERRAETAPEQAQTFEPEGVRADAASALINLGYTRKASEQAVGDVGHEEMTLQDLIRAALARLVR